MPTSSCPSTDFLSTLLSCTEAMAFNRFTSQCVGIRGSQPMPVSLYAVYGLKRRIALIATALHPPSYRHSLLQRRDPPTGAPRRTRFALRLVPAPPPFREDPPPRGPKEGPFSLPDWRQVGGSAAHPAGADVAPPL